MSENSFDKDELYTLLDAIREGRISQSEANRLEAIIREHPDARRLYLRCRLVEGLFEQSAIDIPCDELAEERTRHTLPRFSIRTWHSFIVTAVLTGVAMVGAGILFFPGDTGEAPKPQSPLAKADRLWHVTPVGEAKYLKISPVSYRLISGELEIRSATGTNDPDHTQEEITVETPAGRAEMHGSSFLVGFHELPSQDGETEMNSVARVLVLAGIATLTNASGVVTGTDQTLLAAGKGTPPAKYVAQANTEFAAGLYAELAAENPGKNLFFSPYSVSMALNMALEGARGETAEQMGDTLGLPASLRRIGDDAQTIPWRTSIIHSGVEALNRQMNSRKVTRQQAELRKQVQALRTVVKQKQSRLKVLDADDPVFPSAASSNLIVEIEALGEKIRELDSQVDQYEIKIANSLWCEKNYPLQKDYVATINKHYQTGGVFPVDFRGNHDGERQNINRWVARQTKDHIKHLLPAGSVTANTRFALVNAIYFQGDWAVPFEQQSTSNQPFHLSNGKKVSAAMMRAYELKIASYAAFNADGSFFATPEMIKFNQKTGLYPGAGGFTMAALPYKGRKLSFIVIAPNSPDNLGAIEKQLSPENLNRWIAQLRQRKTSILLPKLKLKTSYTLGATGNKHALQRMGMTSAFVPPSLPNGANFRGMFASRDAQTLPHLNVVVHQAYVEVNESGTVAVAATAAPGGGFGLQQEFPFNPVFRADRPFIFLIRDNASGTILFLGRVVQP